MACSEQDVFDRPNTNAGKEPIVLSIGGVSGNTETRAVITSNPNNPHNYFDVDKKTKVFFVMKSDYDETHQDFAGSHTSKYTICRGDVDPNTAAVKYDAVNQKYWDDAHARSSKLSLWAYAQVGMDWTTCTFEENNPGGSGMNAFKELPHNTTTEFKWRDAEVLAGIFNWKASHYTDDTQDATTLMCQDLYFSNNLADNTSRGGSDGRLGFDFSTRKFPQEGEAVMNFYHAMSKITIRIIEGEGFDKTKTTDFNFASNTNVKLSHFNTKGLFSIVNGQFEVIHERKDINTIYLASTTPTEEVYYTLHALAVPNIHTYLHTVSGGAAFDEGSRFVKDANSYATNTMMEFTIDNSKYQITSGMLYDALHKRDASNNLVLVPNATEKTDNGTYIPMEAGKNYIFTFEIGKAKIKELTATVADWEEVTAEKEYPTNARIELILEEREKNGVGKRIEDPADVYRAADPSSDISDTHETYNWNTGYTTEDNNIYEPVAGGTGWKLRNDWFWPDNKHYYHFRAVMPTKETLSTNTVTTVDGIDCLSLTAGNPYTDVCWGAPFRDVAKNDVSDDATYKFNYDFVNSKGFGTTNTAIGGKNQLYQAIGPTEDYLKLILFHMMSEVTIEMTSNAGADYVNLGDGLTEEQKTTVKIEDYYTTGRVQMGNGLVVPSGTKGDSDLPKIYSGESNNSSTFGVVPQDLTDVQLRITTPDHNEYVVKLTDIKASSAPSSKNMANPYVLSDGKYTIDRWYPGFKYHYKLVLKKKQVEILSATILEWETVTADEETVQIK